MDREDSAAFGVLFALPAQAVARYLEWDWFTLGLGRPLGTPTENWCFHASSFVRTSGRPLVQKVPGAPVRGHDTSLDA